MDILDEYGKCEMKHIIMNYIMNFATTHYTRRRFYVLLYYLYF